MSSLVITALDVPGLKRIERRLHKDERGVFGRLFCASELAPAGWPGAVAQINHSHTIGRGTVRGLHYQRPPHHEAKLVSCIRGEVWDVMIDLRADSPTFLHWHAEHLSASAGTAVLIPPGFAHGFQVLGEEADLVYCHSAPYQPQAEAGLDATDPMLNIPWPLPVGLRSPRDLSCPPLTADFPGVTL